MPPIKFVTFAVTASTRARINAYAAWATGAAGRRLSNSEALDIAITVAQRHPDEVKELARPTS